MNFCDMIAKKNYKHYKSIINLTIAFQGRNKKEGLQQKHYRYALQRDNGIGETEGIIAMFGKKGDKFDEKRKKLEDWYGTGKIHKDCIEPGNILSNYLKLLLDRDWLKIANPGEKTRKYRVPLTIFGEFSKMESLAEIKLCPIEFINDFEEIIPMKKASYLQSDFNFPPKTNTKGVLFGFPIDIRDRLSEYDNQVLTQCLLNIYGNLVRINTIKYNHTDDSSMVSVYASASIMLPRLNKRKNNVD